MSSTDRVSLLDPKFEPIGPKVLTLARFSSNGLISGTSLVGGEGASTAATGVSGGIEGAE